MNNVLITGADGHLGAAMARQLLATSNRRLLLMVRAENDDVKEQKSARLGDLASDTRCELVFADLRDASTFDAVDAGEVSEIIHTAAATSFGVDRKTAEQVNVEGTRKVVAFAGRCPELQRLVYLSSLYATGLNSGPVTETPLAVEPEFANHYEWSKWQAEKLIAAEDDLPWQIHRVATLLAEGPDGSVVQQNAIHNTLRLLFYGLLSVVPGTPGTRVYMTTTQYAVETICQLLASGESQRVFHVSDDGKNACTLGQLLDTVYEAFKRDPGFAKLRILKPLFCDLDSFNTLADGAMELGGAMAQSLQSVAPFAPQLFNDKDVQSGTRLPSPDSRALLEKVCDHLAATRWGLRNTAPERAS